MQEYRLTVDKFIDHAARWFGEAAVTGPERRTYTALRDRSNRLSGALLSLGAKPGDRVATLAWNTVAHFEIYYAVMGAGMVCHTLNPRMTSEQLAAIIVEAEDRIVAVSSDLLPLLRQAMAIGSTVEHVILLDGEGADAWILEDLLAERGKSVLWGRFNESQQAGLCYTSGTTGRPKGAVYTHRGNYLHTLRALQADAMALTAADTVLVGVPMFHANGWGLPFAAPAVGASLVLPGRTSDGPGLARLMRDEKVTVAVGIHTLWVGVAEYLEAAGEGLPDLERVIIGGSSCPEALIERIEKILGVEVQTSWGMTELYPLGTIRPVGSARPPLSSGRPPMGLDLKVVDEKGGEVGVETSGHLHVRGASLIDRYFGDADSAVDDDGYFNTGDLAIIGGDGNLTISGRSKDLIKSGGEWINPADIESVVGSDETVGLVAVIGMADAKWTERPLLVIQPGPGRDLDIDRIVAAMRGALARWWIPDRIATIAEMPLTGSGKIDKMRLRADVAAGKIQSEPLTA